MTNITRSIHASIGLAWVRLVGFAIPCTIVWFIADNSVYWFFLAMHAVFGSPPPVAAQLQAGENILANLVTYVVGAMVLANVWVQSGFIAAGKATNTSPFLLYTTGQSIASGLSKLLFPFAIVLFGPYVLWQIILVFAGLCGVRGMLERQAARHDQHTVASGNVIDISSRSSWQPGPIA